MFDVGLPEFFVLGLVALLVFGPERLPEVALQAARMIRRLRGMAESAKSELTENLEPHMRELSELRELDPRKMARRYVLDPVDEDGTLKSLRGKKLLDPSEGAQRAKRKAKAAAAGSAGVAAADSVVPTDAVATPPANGSGDVPDPAGPALPPAMAPAVTSVGEQPPYDLDAT